MRAAQVSKSNKPLLLHVLTPFLPMTPSSAHSSIRGADNNAFVLLWHALDDVFEVLIELMFHFLKIGDCWSIFTDNMHWRNGFLGERAEKP